MDNAQSQQTVAGAVRRYPIVVGVIALAIMVAAVLVIRLRPVPHVAEAAVVLAEPTDLVIGDSIGGVQSSERRVGNQIVILASESVAERAAELLAGLGYELDSDAILENTTIEDVDGTDVITISFGSDSAELSRSVVRSIVDAYVALLRDQRIEGSQEVIERLEAAQSVIEADLSEVRQQISEVRARRGFDDQITAVLDSISDIQRQLSGEPDPETEEALLSRQGDLAEQLDRLTNAAQVESAYDELGALLVSEADFESRLTQIANRRAAVEIDAVTAASGVSNVSITSQPMIAGAGTAFTALAGLALGLIVGSTVAYILANRNRTFANRSEPLDLLGFPYLSDVPDFAAAGVHSDLPVRDEPRSTVAESFRFASASLEIQRDKAGANSIMVVSANVGDGKSTIVANTALATARSGGKVLVIDADFGNQAVSKLLAGEGSLLQPGLTEAIANTASLGDVVQEISVSSGGSVHLIGRGTLPVTAPDFFADKRVRSQIERFGRQYDVVYIDSPPLLQVAYASSIAAFADGLVVVLKHGSSTATAFELESRLRFMQSTVFGYIYNRAPMRSDMLESGGSMHDILGDKGFGQELGQRRR